MASSSQQLKLLSAVLICIAVAAPLAEAAIICSTVTKDLSPCLNYLKNNIAIPPVACCAGIKTVSNMAKTTLDRQATCKCLKSIAASVSGINYGKAAALPEKCGVNIPYKISPSTDCSKVT